MNITKIQLANCLADDMLEDIPCKIEALKQYNTLEKKYLKGNTQISLEDFAIPINDLPYKDIDLLNILGELNPLRSKQKFVLLESTINHGYGQWLVTFYITIEKYAELQNLSKSLINILGE